MKRYKKIPNGHWRVKFLDYITHSTLEITSDKVGEMLNTDDLDIVLKEINENVGWGIFIEDIYWNKTHRCIEIEMGT